MNINIDKMIQTGFKHNICEDAVLIGDSPFPYIIVADGCSSSHETHIGSNILAKSAEYVLTNRVENNEDMKDIGIEIINRAWNIAKQIPVEKEALDSTLLMSWVIGDKLFYVIFGDGAIFYKNNGQDIIQEYEKEDNMPDYLSYFLSDSRKKLYYEKSTSLKKDVFVKNSIFNIDYKEDIFQYEIKSISISHLEHFIISTDGICSFWSGDDYLKVESLGVTNFKNLTGDFIERRIKRIIKINKKNDVYHNDDIGMAGFSFNKDSEKVKGDENEQI